MQELKKIYYVIKKIDKTAPHENMLILDAGTGQNTITQTIEFNKSIPITGITLTKMDGTAKGGILFSIAQTLNIPIRFIGTGEKIDDINIFHAKKSLVHCIKFLSLSASEERKNVSEIFDYSVSEY